MSCMWHLSLGIEHYGLESQGRLGTCSGVDFPEGAGGKAAANFHSDMSSKTAGIVEPFNFRRPLGEREGQDRRTCEERLGQGNSRIICVKHRVDSLPSCGLGQLHDLFFSPGPRKIASAMICLLMKQVLKLS